MHLLKTLYRKHELPKENVYKILAVEDNGQPEKHIAFLKRNNLIREHLRGGKPTSCGGQEGGEYIYEITLEGIGYVEQRRRDDVQFWLPTLIALAALIIGA